MRGSSDDDGDDGARERLSARGEECSNTLQVSYESVKAIFSYTITKGKQPFHL